MMAEIKTLESKQQVKEGRLTFKGTAKGLGHDFLFLGDRSTFLG
jgi:hypothetical protein